MSNLKVDKKTREVYKGPKPSIPVDWWWYIDKIGEDDKGNWYIEGYCSTYEVDLGYDEITKEFAEKVVNELIGLTVLYNHDPDYAIGKIVEAHVDDVGIWVKAYISKQEPVLWGKMKEGVLNKFSIRILEGKSKSVRKGNKVVDQIYDGGVSEISVTSLPMNRGARASNAYVAKSFNGGSEEMGFEESLKAVAGAVQTLVQGVETGALKDLIPEDKTKSLEGDKAKAAEALKSAGIEISDEILVKIQELSGAQLEGWVKDRVEEKKKSAEKDVPEFATRKELSDLLETVKGTADQLAQLVEMLPSMVEEMKSATDQRIKDAFEELGKELKVVASDAAETAKSAAEKADKAAGDVEKVKSATGGRTSLEEEDESGKSKPAEHPFSGFFPAEWNSMGDAAAEVRQKA